MNNGKDNYRRLHRSPALLGLLIFFLCRVFLLEPLQESLAGENPQPVSDAAPCAEPLFKLTPKQLSISLWARDAVASKTGGKVPRQRFRDLDTLYGEAAAADQSLRQMTRELAACTGGKAVFPPGGGLKGRKRAQEKVEVELGGDASLLMDISRSSIEYGDVDQVYCALQYIIEKGYDVVRLKDRALVPLPSGFWDIHLNLRMPNGHIAELQLHLRKIRQYSIEKGHQYYARIRAMEARAVRENRPLTREERATIDRLNCEQRGVYKSAFEWGQRFVNEKDRR